MHRMVGTKNSLLLQLQYDRTIFQNLQKQPMCFLSSALAMVRGQTCCIVTLQSRSAIFWSVPGSSPRAETWES